MLVAFIAWWLWPSSSLPMVTATSAKQSQPEAVPFTPTGQKSTSIPSEQELAKTPEEKREKYEEKAREVGKSYNRPSKFYGRILDQNDQPIAGVKVACDLSYFGDLLLPGLNPHNKKFERTTDNEGRFKVEDENGLSLELRLQPKEDYSFKPSGLQVMLRDEGANKPAPTLSTPEKPYIFRGFKKGQAEALLSGSIFKLCEQDGRFYIVNLKGNQIGEGAAGGDLKISVRRPPGWVDQKDYDWSVQIDGTEMELLETKDEVVYQAPTTGYVPAWNFAQKAGEESYVRKVNPKFYLKSRDGSIYGRIEMDLTSNYRDKFGVRIRYWLNPSGSRNLEYDPAKKIKP